MINIYSSDGRTILAKVPITREAVHEEEMMTSNFVRLSWKAKVGDILPAGSYIIPFEDEYDASGRPLKYFLLENYSPTAEKENRFTYEPQFQHPVMWLSKIPFIHLTGDTTSWDRATKNYDWTFTGPPATIANEIVVFINTWCGLDSQFSSIFGNGWVAEIKSDLAATATISFSANDILSAASVVANAFECGFHFDFAMKTFFLGNSATQTSSVELKTGENIGIANISRTRREYYNRYVVLGGTKNLTQETASGENAQLNTRLTLSESYPDSVLDLRSGDVAVEVSASASEPMMTGELIFDDIYPKIELYLYNPRQRLCWLLNENGERTEDPDGQLDELDGKKYKCYAKWYIRLAYCLTTPIQGLGTLATEVVDGVTYYWYEFSMNENMLVEDRPLSILFQANYTGSYTSPLASREFQLVWYETTPSEPERGEDDVDPYGFQPTAGDYRIEFDDSTGIIIPTTIQGGLCPKGGVEPSINNNKVTLVNIALDQSYILTAQNELYEAAVRKIRHLHSDLNTYTFKSNPLAFRLNNPGLFVGQGVVYDNGQDLNGSSSYRLNTYVRKLVTRLDDLNIQEISIGNEKIKGNISTMKDQIETIIAGSGGEGGGLTENQFINLLRNYGSRLFLSKIKADSAQEKITFLGGADFGAGGAWGYVREIITNGVSEVIAWFKNLKADVLQVLNYIKGPLVIKGGDVTISKDEGGNGGDLHVEGDTDTENLTVRDSITTNNLTVTGLAHFFELVIDKLRASGGAQIYTCADGFVVQDLERSGSYLYLYWRATDGDRKIKNMWEIGDQAICMSFNAVTSAGSYSNVDNKFYWSVVAGKGTEVHRYSLGDGEYEDVDSHYIKIYTGSNVNLNSSTYNSHYVGNPNTADIGDEVAMLGSRATTTDATQRQVAVYLSAYASYDTGNADRPGLTAPLLAFYKGLDNFDLTSHRTTYIDANGSEFRGNFFITGSNGDVDINSLFNGSEVEIIFGYGNPNEIDPAPHSTWTDAEKLAKIDKVLYYDLNQEPASEGGRLYKWVYQQANPETETPAGYLWILVTDIDTTAALDHIRDVASDGKLSGGSEKLRVFLDWTDAKKTCTSLMAQATEDNRAINTDNTNTYDGVHTYKSAYDGIVNAFNYLSTYLNNLVTFTISSEGYPAWIDPNNQTVGIKVTTVLPPWTDHDPTFTTGAMAYRTLWMNFYAAAVELTRAINAYQFQKIDEMGDDGLLDPAEKAALREIFAGEVKHYFEMMDEAASYGVDQNGDFTGEYTDEYGYTQTLEDLVKNDLSHLGTYLDGVLEGAVIIRPNAGERPQTLPPDTWIVNDNMRNGLTEEAKPADTSTAPLPDERSGYPKWLLRENLTKEEDVNDDIWDGYWRYYRLARAAMEDALLRAREKKQDDDKPTVFITNNVTLSNPMPTPPPYKVGDLWYEQISLQHPVTQEWESTDENGNPLYNEYVCWAPYDGSSVPSYNDKASYWKLVKGAVRTSFIVDSKKGEIILAVFDHSRFASIETNLQGITQTVSQLGASRNLLLNGDFSAVSNGMNLANFTVPSSGYTLRRNQGNAATGFTYSAYLEITTSATGRGLQMTKYSQPCLLLKSGSTYVLSIYAKAGAAADSGKQLAVYRASTRVGSMTDTSDNPQIQTLTSDYQRFQFIFSGSNCDGTEQTIAIAPQNNTGGNTTGQFYFCGIQLEEGSSVTTWMAGEDNTGVLSTQIKQQATQIDLAVTKDGIQQSGITLNANGCIINGNKTTITGDLDVRGLITNSASLILNTNTTYTKTVFGEYQTIIPIDLNSTKSIVVKDGYKPIVILPGYEQYSVNGKTTMPAIQTSGIQLTITNAFTFDKRGWRNPSSSVASLWDDALLVVADPRILMYSNYTGGSTVDPNVNFNADPTVSMFKNILFSGGDSGKLLAVMPGQTVSLVSSVEDYNGTTYLAWYVQNSESFKPVSGKVVVKVYASGSTVASQTKNYGFDKNSYYNEMNLFAPSEIDTNSSSTEVTLLEVEENEWPKRG